MSTLSSTTFPNAAAPQPPASDQQKPKPKRPAPLSIRLSEAQKAQLREEAGRGSVNAYVIKKLFGESAAQSRRAGRTPSADHQALARALGALGQSRLSQNMNQIAKAANMGVLPVSAELERELSEACTAIKAMRSDLLAALGLQK
ncbi:MAG: hypothetical protein AAF869_08405 [Pseudomonadota bacterium]